MLTPDNCVDSPWLSLDSLTSWHEVHPTQVDIWFTQHKLTWGSPNTSWHMVHPTQVDIWFTQHKLTFGSPNTSWHKVHPTQVDIRFTQHKLTYGSPNTSWSQVSCCYVNALTNETLEMYVAFFNFVTLQVCLAILCKLLRKFWFYKLGWLASTFASVCPGMESNTDYQNIFIRVSWSAKFQFYKLLPFYIKF